MLAGIDTHKDSLAVAIIDHAGRPVVVTELPNTESGFNRLEELLAGHRVGRVGIEGSGNFGRGAALRLVLAGRVEVVEVPPAMTSRERSGRPGQGKTDPVDAVAIARITAREPLLPPVRLTVGAAADLRATVDYRDQLVEESTSLANRVHAELHGLLPGYHTRVPRLTSRSHLVDALALLEGDDRLRADLTRRRLARMLEIDTEVREMTKRLREALTDSGTRLTDIYGVGPVIASTLLGHIVDVRRYRSRHAFAAANGTAPIPASSGRTSRHRLNRSGNRQMNRCLYTIAITQIRADTEGRAYYRRKLAEGKTPREALRCAASSDDCPTSSTAPCAKTWPTSTTRPAHNNRCSPWPAENGGQSHGNTGHVSRPKPAARQALQSQPALSLQPVSSAHRHPHATPNR